MKQAFFILMLFAGCLSLYAELETSVELTALATLTRDAAGTVIVSLLGKGNLTFAAINNPNVRAECELEGVWAGSFISSPDDILKRLFVKINFGGVYLALGKTRVSFGEGFVFNAGDVIFGSMTPVADLSTALLRDDTDWLIDLSVPLGDFSFIEAILLPYSPLKMSAFPYSTVYDLRGGGRLVTKLAGIKIETGYLFRADEATHNPYLSLQGNIFFDAQISASLKIPALDYTDEKLKEGFALSAGLFRMFTFEDSSTLLIRLEAACWPFGAWEDVPLASPTAHYALLLYPEISYSPLDVLVLQLRAMISPVENSGLISFGVTFGIYQGLDLLSYLWCMWGDTDDLYFGFGRYGDIGFSFGVRFIY